MKRERRLLWVLVTLSLLLLPMAQGCAPTAQTAVPGGPGSSPPVITHWFAADKGIYGSAWQIYLEAEDPDGDMARIAAVVTQVGYGYYPTNWTNLSGTDGKSLKGYLQWNTFSSEAGHMPEWTQITVAVTVIDRSGNQSNEAVFPFTFESGVGGGSVSALPPPFNQGENKRLGWIQTNLKNPNAGASGR